MILQLFLFNGQFFSNLTSPHLRPLLMTLCVVRSHNILGSTFLEEREALPKKAILATAHKLLRVLFAMLSSKSYFRKEVVEV